MRWAGPALWISLSRGSQSLMGLRMFTLWKDHNIIINRNCSVKPVCSPYLSAILWQECIICIKLFMILLTFLKYLWKDGSSTTAVYRANNILSIVPCRKTATQHNSSTLTFQELLLIMIGTRYQWMHVHVATLTSTASFKHAVMEHNHNI